MTENFKTTQMDELFYTNSIKTPFSGASYKEINDYLVRALSYNQDIKIIIRGLDTNRFTNKSDTMRFELGEYPVYLYDDNKINDIKYIFNRDVVFNYTYAMTRASKQEGFNPGITSFDEYSEWMLYYIDMFGRHQFDLDDQPISAGEPSYLSEELKQNMIENIELNVVTIARENPEVIFIFF